MLYWDVGKLVASRQNEEGWGTSVIPRLAKDIKNDMSEVKGFSARNISRMLNFYKEYSTLPDYLHDLFHASHINDSILPTPLAKLPWAVVLIFQLFTKQYLAKLLHCMAWNCQAAKQKTFGSTGDCGQWNFLKAE